jgi:hypothetical protein
LVPASILATPAQPFEYLRIALAGTLILASHLILLELIAETVFFVAHIPPARLPNSTCIRVDRQPHVLPGVAPTRQALGGKDGLSLNATLRTPVR